jgi:transposase
VIALRADLKVVMAAHPVDFRKSVHTLSALVSEALRANPYCGTSSCSAPSAPTE